MQMYNLVLSQNNDIVQGAANIMVFKKGEKCLSN